jgi:hypothetical protein
MNRSKGSDEKMMAAASTVRVGAGFRNLVSNSTGTEIVLIVDFYAYGILSNWFQDIFAVIWSEPLTVASSSGTLRYVNDLKQSYYSYPTPDASGIYARNIKFRKYVANGSHPYYIHSGSMIFELKSNIQVNDFAAYAAYGYNMFKISPSVSYPGALSITFSKGVTTVGSSYTSI